LPHIVDRNNVRMAELGHRHCFPAEPSQPFGSGAKTSGVELDGHFSAQSLVPGEINGAQATLSEYPDDHVSPDLGEDPTDIFGGTITARFGGSIERILDRDRPRAG